MLFPRKTARKSSRRPPRMHTSLWPQINAGKVNRVSPFGIAENIYESPDVERVLGKPQVASPADPPNWRPDGRPCAAFAYGQRQLTHLRPYRRVVRYHAGFPPSLRRSAGRQTLAVVAPAAKRFANLPGEGERGSWTLPA